MPLRRKLRRRSTYESALIADAIVHAARASFERTQRGAATTAPKKTGKSGPRSRRQYRTNFVNYEVFAWVHKYDREEKPTKPRRIYYSIESAVESWRPALDEFGCSLCRQLVKGYRIVSKSDSSFELLPKDVSKKESWKRIDRRRWRDLAVASYMEKCLLL
jgi:hypothetical protein